MARRWSKPEMWVPGGYLALVLSMLVYIAIASRTGDIGMFAALPILATAPVSLLLLSAFIPDPDSFDESVPAGGPGYEGSQLPPEPPMEFLPESAPRPADWVPPDTSLDDSKLGLFGEFGLYGAVLVGALVNAGAIWALLRYVARRAVAAAAARG
ncbi:MULTISPECIES: SCO4225 family membrane protein [unclassified Streptomyces]|uniref:SCO4225 family membrane protein n=1 Tax=unclassified Streptomyces TaxID=2593676 RepID=UPI00202EDA5F|nr:MULTISPECIES: hypothetical protein [unclassified Streptomyces]MCM1965704.1 hypothetical protein [Streptomyces sp. G1]MCX5123860.1 hypothetical protein [Streptomyces sp. NBC_00347]MCX5297105.1 hypothetical protein [Streptomyces sp. NBC_00193]